MILVCYQRTMQGAAQRAAQRGRTLAVELPAPKPQPAPVVAPEPVPEPVPVILGEVVVAFPTRYREHRRIIDLVARMHGVTHASLIGPRRYRMLINPRQAAMCAVKEWETINGRQMSLPQLGRLFGNRDHTTVLSAIRKRGYKPEGKQ